MCANDDLAILRHQHYSSCGHLSHLPHLVPCLHGDFVSADFLVLQQIMGCWEYNCLNPCPDAAAKTWVRCRLAMKGYTMSDVSAHTHRTLSSVSMESPMSKSWDVEPYEKPSNTLATSMVCRSGRTFQKHDVTEKVAKPGGATPWK